MKIKLSILDDNDNTLASTTIDRNKYYRTRIEHGKGLLDDVHKQLSEEFLPHDLPGFAAFFMEREQYDGPFGYLNVRLKTKVIPAYLSDDFVDTFGKRITILNTLRNGGLCEREIDEFLIQRTDNPQI